jgi:hypothetical protein
MCTLSGIKLFRHEIAMFEQINTAMVAKPMLIPLIADEVVPNVGHIPRSNTNVGFSFIRPLIIIPNLLII